MLDDIAGSGAAPSTSTLCWSRSGGPTWVVTAPWVFPVAHTLPETFVVYVAQAVSPGEPVLWRMQMIDAVGEPIWRRETTADIILAPVV